MSCTNMFSTFFAAALIIAGASATPAQRRHRNNAAGSNRLLTDHDRAEGMVVMVPQQSCYYQTYNKRLTCKCNSTDTAAVLHLRMRYYVFDSGNEIRAVHLEQCRELRVTLDLQRVDATNVPFHFKAIRKVSLSVKRLQKRVHVFLQIENHLKVP